MKTAKTPPQLKKLKVKQRDETREVYAWALEFGKDLAGRTLYLSLTIPGTDNAVMYATHLTQLFDKYLAKSRRSK